MDDSHVTAAIDAVWVEIEAWYGAHAPALLDALEAGASEAEINAFEAATGIMLPEDYRASLRRHNGDVYVHDYQYLSLEGVQDNWERMTRFSEDGTFDDRDIFDPEAGTIQATWWHRRWIPFAEDGGGNMLCIDTAPGPHGEAGQIVHMELAAGPVPGEQASFLEWLEGYKDDLYAGLYGVDEDGLLYEA